MVTSKKNIEKVGQDLNFDTCGERLEFLLRTNKLRAVILSPHNGHTNAFHDGYKK